MFITLFKATKNPRPDLAFCVMMTYYLFRNYRILGSRAAGVKPHGSVKVFFEISPELKLKDRGILRRPV
jgi:hypothetical protein